MRLWDLYRDKQDFIKPSLERIRKACEYIGKPHRNFRSILVGGTNGKGSTCAFIERILREAGYKTGWFVSPHLLDERERWRIRGESIPEEVLHYYIRDLRSVFEKFNLTYFESCTLLAIKYFSDEHIDIGVFEVGMGGRWDATKMVEPEVVVLTNVGRDHTKWLGDTVEEIAKDKMNLYIKGKPFIIGEFRYPLSTFNICKDFIVGGYDFFCKGYIKDSITVLEEYCYKDYILDSVKLGMWGKWQITNASLALTSVLNMVDGLSADILKAGLTNARIEGRLEIVREKPLIMLDCAHNPHAISRVIKEVFKYFPSINIVFSSLKDKEWRESLKIIRNYTDSIFIVNINHPRAEDFDKLGKEAKSLEFKNVFMLESVSDIFKLNIDILVIGSIYLIGEVKGMLKF